MSQILLPYQYEVEAKETGFTGLCGLPLYLDLMHRAGLEESIDRHIGARAGSQGWTDREMIHSLILLNLAGGDCVDDLRVLEADDGFCRVLNRIRLHGMSRSERKAVEKCWRKEQQRMCLPLRPYFVILAFFMMKGKKLFVRMARPLFPKPMSF